MIPIDQYGYFDITGMIPPIANHGIWGCLPFLPLVSNVFLACYDSGTFLSHLTEGGYGFDVLGSPGRHVPDVCCSSNGQSWNDLHWSWPHLQTPWSIFWRHQEMCNISQNFLR